MRRTYLLLGIAAGFIMAGVFLRHNREARLTAPPSAAGVAGLPAPNSRPPNSLDLNRRAASTPMTTAGQEKAAEQDPDLIAVKETLRAYRSTFGENPTGTNAEITKALLGSNARRANFGDPDLKVKEGQLVDHWGHSYFFHQLSRSEMEIRSAGPDGIMWTADDEVLR